MNQTIPPPSKRMSAWRRNPAASFLTSWITGIATATALFVQAQFSGAQTSTINFDTNANWTASGSLTSYGSHSYAESNWSFTSALTIRNGTTAQDGFPGALGTYSWRLQDSGTPSLTATLNQAESIAGFGFDVRRWDGTPDPVYSVEYSTNSGSNWTNVGTINNAYLVTSDWKTFAHTFAVPVSVNSGEFRVRISRTSGERIMVDNFRWTVGSINPIVSTGAASVITNNSVTLGGTISNTGTATPSERGIFYSTTDGFANGAGTKVSDLAGGFGTGPFTQNVTGLSAGTTYYFKAFATNTNGTGYGSQASFITLPDVPSTPTASAVGSSGFTVNWSAVTGAASYRLDLATDSGFTSLVTGYNNLSVATTSQAVAGLDPSTTYYARVRAVNASGSSANSATLTQATDATTAPTITLSPNTLTGFSVVFGAGASTSQAFTVTGANLSPLGTEISIVATSTDYEVSADNVAFGNTAVIPYVGTSIVAPAYARLKAGLAVGNYDTQVIPVAAFGTEVRNLTVSGSVTSASPPTLSAALTASVDAPFNVTFTDNSVWRTGISGVTVNGTLLTAGYTVSAGIITFTPSASVPASLLRTPGSKTIVVQSANFSDASVSQTIAAGTASQLVVTTQPTAPSVNGGSLATQPVVTFRDQYGNSAASAATVTASVGAGTWTLGGTTSVAATSGVATFSGLTATSAAAVTGATIVFSSAGLPDVTSSIFNIIAPPPANDNPLGAIALSLNTTAISGTLAGSTPMTGSTLNDVWYSFVAVGPSATITINTFSPTGNRNLYVYSELPTTYSTTTNVVASGTSLSTTTETATASNFVAGTTYYILVQDLVVSSGTFNISVTNTPSAPTTLAASNVTATGFTANWNAVPGVSSYRIDVYRPTQPVTTDLIFSEYVEGSSNNKYIEIYNGTATAVNLADYEVRLFPNGGSTANPGIVLNTIGAPTSLASGGTLVIRNSQAALTLPSGVTAYSSGVTGFNGDDALGLFKISTSSYVDIFGRIGSDPGTAWVNASPSLSTEDKTLRRKSTVTSGVTTNPTGIGTGAFTTLATEWEQFDIDTVSGLGSHDPVRNYVASYLNADAGAATSLSITGLTQGTGYIYVVRAVAGSATSVDSDLRNVTTSVVNSLPTFTGYTTSTGVNSPVIIAESAILANTSDANGDTVTISAVSSSSTQGGTVTRSGGNVTYTPAVDYIGTDTFAITFTDGIGTVNGDVTITVGGADPLFTDPTMNAVLSDQPAGVKRLSFTGIPGRVYGIQRSGNLSGWTQIDTVTAPPGGAVTFDDPSPLSGKGFYRIIFPAE